MISVEFIQEADSYRQPFTFECEAVPRVGELVCLRFDQSGDKYKDREGNWIVVQISHELRHQFEPADGVSRHHVVCLIRPVEEQP